MLSLGDQVFLDGETDPAQRWTVRAAARGVDFSTGEPTNLYTLSRAGEVKYAVGAKRITNHWIEA